MYSANRALNYLTNENVWCILRFQHYFHIQDILKFILQKCSKGGNIFFSSFQIQLSTTIIDTNIHEKTILGFLGILYISISLQVIKNTHWYCKHILRYLKNRYWSCLCKSCLQNNLKFISIAILKKINTSDFCKFLIDEYVKIYSLVCFHTLISKHDNYWNGGILRTIYLHISIS